MVLKSVESVSKVVSKVWKVVSKVWKVASKVWKVNAKNASYPKNTDAKDLKNIFEVNNTNPDYFQANVAIYNARKVDFSKWSKMIFIFTVNPMYSSFKGGLPAYVMILCFFL